MQKNPTRCFRYIERLYLRWFLLLPPQHPGEEVDSGETHIPFRVGEASLWLQHQQRCTAFSVTFPFWALVSSYTGNTREFYFTTGGHFHFLPFLQPLKNHIFLSQQTHLRDNSAKLRAFSYGKRQPRGLGKCVRRPTRREPGKRVRLCQPGVPCQWKLGMSGNRKYFLGFGPQQPGRELMAPLQHTQTQLPLPHCPPRLGPLLTVAMAMFQRALHSDRDAWLC